LLAASSLLAATASAGTVTVAYAGGVGAQVSLDAGATFARTNAGAHRLSDPSGSLGLGGADLYTFSVDLERSFRGTASVTTGSMLAWNLGPAGEEQKQRASWIATRFFDTYPSSAPTNAIKGAYQLAIWELLFETSGMYSLTGGNAQFKTGSGAAKRLAAQLIAESAAHGADGYATWLATGASRTRERPDFIGPRLVATPVPEPLSTLGGLALGLSALAVLRRRSHA